MSKRFKANSIGMISGGRYATSLRLSPVHPVRTAISRSTERETLHTNVNEVFEFASTK